MSEKCVCHLCFPDGTKVAIKDAEARRLIELLTASVEADNQRITEVEADVEEALEKAQTAYDYSGGLTDTFMRLEPTINGLVEDVEALKNGGGSSGGGMSWHSEPSPNAVLVFIQTIEYNEEGEPSYEGFTYPSAYYLLATCYKGTTKTYTISRDYNTGEITVNGGDFMVQGIYYLY